MANVMRKHANRRCSWMGAGLACLLLVVCISAAGAAQLKEVQTDQFDVLKVKPGWSLPDGAKVLIEPAAVEFSREWSRDLERTASRTPLREAPREEIASDAADWMADALRQAVTGSQRVKLIESDATDIDSDIGGTALRLHSKVDDLYLASHDPISTIARNETVARDVGKARLIMELVHPATGEIVMRVEDERRTREFINPRILSPALIRQEMTLMMRKFASQALAELP